MEKKKKVLLAFPETSRSKYDYAGIIDDEPYELECLQAHLKSLGIDAEIWDGQMDKDFEGAFRAYKPDYVYFCGRTRQENFVKEYCTLCKGQNNETTANSNERRNNGEDARYGVITIAGGIHGQNCPERFHEEYIDYVVATFDPGAVSDIVLGRDPAGIRGIHYKRTDESGNTVWEATEKVPYDIKNLPWADRSTFYKYRERYCYLELRPIAVIRTAYGCPYSCAFCYRNTMNCHKYSPRDIEDVVEEIRTIDCENIYIIDDDFLVNIHRLERFVELITAYGIKKKFVCFGRADFIAKYPGIIKKLAGIGFYYILTGLEYIENRRLKDTNKKSIVNVNVRAVNILHENGIKMMAMFITDLDFTAHDFSNLYKWIRHFGLKHVAVSIYTPEMCLPNFKDYEDRLITHDPSEWDYLHVVAQPEKMSVRSYYFHYHVLLIKLFLRAYRQGIYDFLDYKGFIKSFLKNMFRFGG